MSRIRLSRYFFFAALAVAMMIPVSAHAGVGFGIGFYGPIYPWGYAYYPYGPYYGPYAPYPGYGYGYPSRPVGEVHIKSPIPDAQIIINGAMAGRARDLKKFYLVPGTYNIEQHIGNDVQKQRVYVIAGRSLKIDFGKPGTPSPPMAPPPAPVNPNAGMAPAPPDASMAQPTPDAGMAPQPTPPPAPVPPAPNQ